MLQITTIEQINTIIGVFTLNLLSTWQNILSYIKEYFSMSQNANPHGMKIFQEYLLMYHGICSQTNFLLFEPIHPFIVHQLTAHLLMSLHKVFAIVFH
jgi:hypothetical protein